MMMCIYLTLGRYDVIEAADGHEAIEKALKHKPDLILMDIAMPVLDGISSTRAIREIEELRTTPILCLTAFDDVAGDSAKQAGCNEVLQKPVDFGRLDALLEKFIH